MRKRSSTGIKKSNILFFSFEGTWSQVNRFAFAVLFLCLLTPYTLWSMDHSLISAFTMRSVVTPLCFLNSRNNIPLSQDTNLAMVCKCQQCAKDHTPQEFFLLSFKTCQDITLVLSETVIPRLKTCCYLKEVNYCLKTEMKLHTYSGLLRIFAVLFWAAGSWRGFLCAWIMAPKYYWHLEVQL